MNDHTSAPVPGREAGKRRRAAPDPPHDIALLNALPAHVALIGPHGVILAVNDLWQSFTMVNPLQGHGFTVGDNYLERCEQATGPGADDARRAAAGIRQLLRGEVQEFAIEYPCHPPGEERWFQLSVTPVRDDPRAGALVIQVDTTGRRQQAQLLHRGQILARTAGRLLGVGVWAIDPKQHTLTWSPKVCSIHDAPADFVPELDDVLQYYAPEFRDAVAAALAACLETGTTFDVEVQIVTSKGRRVWVRAIAEAVRDAAGGIEGLQGAYQDISARKTAEAQASQALRTSEERFRLLAKATNDGIWDWDLITDALWWNDGFTTTFGHRSEIDPTLKGWTDHIHPEDRDRVIDGIHHVIEHGGDGWTDDYRFRRHDGTDAYVLDRGHVIRDTTGRGIRMIGGMTDLTDRRRAEEALRASTEEFRILAEAMPQIVWIAQPDGAYIYLNAHWMEYTGLTLTESLGDGWNRPFHPDDQQRSRDAWQQATATTGPYSLECQLRRADGAYRWWLIRAVPQRSPAGTVLKWFGTCTDIHDLKLAEVQISRANLALQSQIEDRTRAEAAAETANRAKSEFLANMSHEIRTPLNGVIGMTQLALGTDLSREQREYLDLVKSSSESLLTVINDILDFSKIEAGLLTVDVVPFDLRDCIETTLRQLAIQAHVKGVELVHSIASDVPTALLGDPGRLRQIVTNLAGNAVKFTDAGEVVLAVNVEVRADSRAVLLFTVTDTGIGIPADQHEAIFKPFIQGDGSSTRKYGGTGLGLAITRNLVTLLGGSIWLGTTAGGGSAFSFTIPFDLQPAPSPGPARHVGIEHLRDMPVLVVDDNAANRHNLQVALERWQMTPVLADGGRNGMAAMQASRAAGTAFPLVLIDAHMPDLDGFAVAEEIKQDPALAGATILMLTSAGLRGDAARCRELGISAYLVKPISQPELLEAILTVLGVPPAGPLERQVVTRHSLRESRRQLRVLLAEDNKVNQLVASRVLEKRGHSVVIVATGKAALAVLEGGGLGFDLILMDVQMPDMDGFEATAIIRKREKGSGTHLPIIAMTAHAMIGDEARCLAAGMDGYVSKPIQTDQLFATIARIVGSTEAPNQPVS